MAYPVTRGKHQKSQHGHSVRFFAETPIIEGQVVTLGTDDTEVIPSIVASVPLGIALNSVDAASIAAYGVDGNQEHVACEVAVHGMVPVIAGAAIIMGAYVMSDANGRVVPLTFTTGVLEQMVGKAYNVAAGNGKATHIWINMVPSRGENPA